MTRPRINDGADERRQRTRPPSVRPTRPAKLSQAELALTIALVLVANQRPLTVEEIQEALTHAGYDVPALETMHMLCEGPFRCCGTKWVVAMVVDA